MRLTITLICLLITLSSFSQDGAGKVKKKNKGDITGIWEVTNFKKEDDFTEHWKILPDGKIYVLKWEDAGNDYIELLPDEYGKWEQTDSTLIVTFTGEDGKDYTTPVKWICSIQWAGKDLRLDLLYTSSIYPQTITSLRLKKTTITRVKGKAY